MGLSIGPYLKWIGTYTGTYPTLDRHRYGWKQQSGPRATYFVSPLHQAVAMICVSREMFTVGGGQAPRWYPRFTLGDLFATTLIVKWPGASFNGQAPRWYPLICRVPDQKIKKKKRKIEGVIHLSALIPLL